jgi:hypothetical protein
LTILYLFANLFVFQQDEQLPVVEKEVIRTFPTRKPVAPRQVEVVQQVFIYLFFDHIFLFISDTIEFHTDDEKTRIDSNSKHGVFIL